MGSSARLNQTTTMKTLVLLLPALVALTAAQSSSFSLRDSIPSFLVSGQCPRVDEKSLWAQQAPNHGKYAGRWYEVALSKNVFQLVKSCTKNDLSYDGPGLDSVTSSLER